MSVIPLLEIVGTPPALSGRVCDGFVCEGYTYEGTTEATANVTHLKFDGQWYRLYFEPHMVFWRVSDEAPRPSSVEEMSWAYPLEDVGKVAGVAGQRLAAYEMTATSEGSKVVFRFESGKQIIIEDKKEVANYAVI